MKRFFGFTINDILIRNATLEEFTKINERTYSVIITPNLRGNIRLSIKENIAADAVGNGNNPLFEKVIPLQQGQNNSSSYNPLFMLSILFLFLLRHKTKI